MRHLPGRAALSRADCRCHSPPPGAEHEFDRSAVLITLTALLSYVNERLLKLPTPIGVTLGGLVTSVALVALAQAGLGLEIIAERTLTRIDFDTLLMQGLLSFLLFAGSLHVNLNELLYHRWTILLLATFGVVMSTLLIGVGMWWVFGLLGLAVPFLYSLLLGALISPTDPVAVLALLKRAGTPKELETLITGESLFNDGVGVVVFTIIAGPRWVVQRHPPPKPVFCSSKKPWAACSTARFWAGWRTSCCAGWTIIRSKS